MTEFKGYGSTQELLNHYCHIFPKYIDEQGRLFVDYELMFTPDASLVTAEYKLPEDYQGIGVLVAKELLYRGNVWIIHFNDDGSIYCTKRPGYGDDAMMKAVGNENSVCLRGRNDGPMVVNGDDVVYGGEWKFDPDSIIAIFDGGSCCTHKDALCLMAGYPLRTTLHRYDVRIPPYDPAHADNPFLPGYPYDVEIRKNWKYIRAKDIPDGTYSRARFHKGVGEMVNGELRVKAGFLVLNDRDGDYPISDDHVIIQKLNGEEAEAEFYGTGVKTIKLSNPQDAQENGLYTYTVDETAGTYTLTPDTTVQGEPEEVFDVVNGIITEDHFYLKHHGDQEFITLRCAVVIEQNGEKHFGRIAAKKHLGENRTCVQIWGPCDEDGVYQFAYVKYQV